jgi:2-keto-4-pentenoate hydratase
VRTYQRTARSPLERFALDPSAVPTTLDAAYAAQRDMLGRDPARWTGWKLGGTNHASRAAFGVNRLYYGALDQSEILHEPQTAPGFALCEMKGEVEIALRLTATGYDAWCVALEMPACPLDNLMQLGVRALVADRCAAGALLLGPVQDGPLPDLSQTRFTLNADGVTLSDAGLDALIAAPAALLAAFRALAAGHGITPRKGDWVATGGITACCAFVPGSQVQVRLDQSLILDFTVSFGPAHG